MSTNQYLTFILVLFMAGTLPAQNCKPKYKAGTIAGDYIDGVSLGTISNLSSGGIGVPYYSLQAGQSTNLVMGQTYSITLENNPFWQEQFALWIDYDQDNVFDASEKLLELPIPPGASPFVSLDRKSVV